MVCSVDNCASAGNGHGLRRYWPRQLRVHLSGGAETNMEAGAHAEQAGVPLLRRYSVPRSIGLDPVGSR